MGNNMSDCTYVEAFARPHDPGVFIMVTGITFWSAGIFASQGCLLLFCLLREEYGRPKRCLLSGNKTQCIGT